MEVPYSGRAVINDMINHIEIVIPSRKIYFFIIMLCLWLIPSVIGGIIGISQMFLMPDIPIFAALFILVFWAIFVLFVGRILWWMIAGKEVVNINKETLHIQQKGLLFSKIKVYDINECKSFRAADNPFINTFITGGPFRFFRAIPSGSIAFDYG